MHLIPEKRSLHDLLMSGYHLGYHPKTSRFYTYDPNNKAHTFGERGVSITQVRNMVKRGEIEEVGETGEIYRRKSGKADTA